MASTIIRRAIAILAIAALTVGMLASPVASAPNAVSVTLDNSTPGATGVGYAWGWDDYYTAGNIRCVRVLFSENADGTGGLPAGMVLTSATMSGGNYSTNGTWTRDSTSAASGILVFNNGAGSAPAAGPQTFSLGAITNPSSADTYFMTVSTWDTTGSGAGSCNNGNNRDSATVAAFATTEGQTAQVTIDPSLGFTVSPVNSGQACGDVTTTVTTTTNTVDLGRIASNASHSIGGQSLNITTNAPNGYTVYVSSATSNMVGQATARDYTNVAAPNSAPITWPADGTEAFGYHTSDTSLGTGTANRFDGGKFAAVATSNAEVMFNNATPGGSGDTSCVAFQASKAGDTPADTYVITVRYNAVPLF